MKVWSRGSLGNEGMVNGFAVECSYGQKVRWGMKVCSRGSMGMKVWSRGSLGNEGMYKGVTGE